MGKINKISTEIRDWIVNTLNSGVNPELIVDSMVKKGFDSRFAYTVMFQIMRKESIKTSDTSTNPYQYEIPAIFKKGNRITTSDRNIKVTMRLEKPYIIYLDDFLSYKECDELIDMSINRLNRSQVIDSETGVKRTVEGRTSAGTEYVINENRLITKIEKRISEITDHKLEQGEDLQVLNYKKGEEYKKHYDFFPPRKINEHKGGQRIGTLLMYLNDVSEGGETVFSKIGVSVSPKKGAAIYFHYGNAHGQTDRLSLHSSLPVIEGEKWVATKWFRQKQIYN